jgi:hypothetical protein
MTSETETSAIALTRSVQDSTKCLAPTPKQIDALILEHAAAQADLQSGGAIKKLPGESAADLGVRLKAWEAEAGGIRKAALIVAEDVKGRLLAMVAAHGLKHTEKSVRLSGEHNRATVTTGTRSEVQPGAVDNLKAYLDKSEIPELAGRFFIEHISYSMVAGPSEVLKTLTLGARIRTRMTSLIALCFENKTNSPSLKIETVAAAKPATSAKAA